MPYLGFFEKISVADLFILVDDTQFVKRGAFGWIHRNRILGPNGPQWLTIPVLTHGQYDQPIKDTLICQKTNWARKHCRAIEFAYRNAPYFKELFPGIQEIYSRQWTHLLDLSKHCIEWVLNLLDIQIPIQLSSDLQIQGKSSDYVLELAQKAKATHYLSGVHGKDYLNLEQFKKQKLEVIFQDFKCIEYSQGKATSFVSHLSILDPLFWIGPKRTYSLLSEGRQYKLPNQNS